jgi:hypothetical protein
MAKPKKTEKIEKAPAKKPRAKDKAKVEKKAPKKAEKGVPRKVFIEKLGKLTEALKAEKPGAFQWGRDKVTIPIDAMFEIELEKGQGKKEGRIEIEFEIKWQQASKAVKAPKALKAKK